DLFGIGALLTPSAANSFIEVDPPSEFADGLFPSISLHAETGTVGPFHADITYMAQTPESDILRPFVVRMGITLTFGGAPGYPLTVEHTIDWYSEIYDDAGEADIKGNYNMTQLPFIDPGVSSAIVSGTSDRYWAAWCERIEMEPPPVNVAATYGYAGN
ncbi:MAG: hypothetical protein ABIC40_02570, partial [bacterium]